MQEPPRVAFRRPAYDGARPLVRPRPCGRSRPLGPRRRHEPRRRRDGPGDRCATWTDTVAAATRSRAPGGPRRPRARRSRRAQPPRPPTPPALNRACPVTLTLALALIALVLVCAIIQRVAGMGLGIVFAPYAVVLIGAHEGIMLANFLGGLMPIVMLPRIWSQIEWDK